MLIDSQLRRFSYLRLSITEKCNFKCSYCLPNGYKKSVDRSEFLNPEEIYNLAFAMRDLGIKKIRITGGEPTLRADIVEIIRLLKQDLGFETIAMTTNGYRLKELLGPLKNAGLDALNISLDTLNASQFKKICGLDFGDAVRESIDLAAKVGISKVKINSVLLKGLNDEELEDYLNFVKARKLSVRFIELMRTGDNKDFFGKHYLSLSTFEAKLRSVGWMPENVAIDAGPAKEFGHPDYKGKIGFISPYSRNFCAGCNRLRVSSRGALRLCLFGDGDISLRDLIQKPSDRGQLKELICSSLQAKPSTHRLHENIYGMADTLSSIGG